MRTLYFVLWFLLFSSPNLSRRRLHVCHTSTQSWCGLSANFGRRSETCCTRLAENTRRNKSCLVKLVKIYSYSFFFFSILPVILILVNKRLSNRQKFAICAPSQKVVRLCLRNQGMYRQSEKMSNSNISPTCPYNMVNFGRLSAEIGSLVRGTPANFNGFRVFAALLHGTLVVGVSQTLRR